jgi:hypothetical protein
VVAAVRRTRAGDSVPGELPGVAWWLTLVLFGLAVISSVGGAFFEHSLYAADRPYWTAQVFAQDAAILGLIAPLLLGSAIRARRGSRRATLVWLGTCVFLLYVYACYGFLMHLGPLFLVHCAAFGAAFYAVATGLLALDGAAVRAWYPARARLAPTIAYLACVGGAMTAFWLITGISASVTATLPDYAVQSGFATSPFHVLDLGIFFPGLVVAAALLRRRSAFGFLLAPVLVVYSTVMTSCLIEQALVLQARGFDGGLEFAPVFAAVFGFGIVVVAHLLRQIPDRPANSVQS